MKIKMIYIGAGNSLPGVPARDLNEDEVSLYGRQRLLESGLYQSAESSKQKNTSTEEKGE